MRETIDLVDLSKVMGGQKGGDEQEAEQPVTGTRETSFEFSLPLLGNVVSYKNTHSEPDRYLRCLDLIKRQAKGFERADTTTARQERLCGPTLK